MAAAVRPPTGAPTTASPGRAESLKQPSVALGRNESDTRADDPREVDLNALDLFASSRIAYARKPVTFRNQTDTGVVRGISVRMSGPHGAWLSSPHALLASSSGNEQWARTAVWITSALSRQEKVFYSASVHDPLSGTAAAVADSVHRSSGRPQIEILDPEHRPAVLEEPPVLYAWYRGLVDRARREGFRGAAFTGGTLCDCPADRAGDVKQVLAYERLVGHVTSLPGVRVLCRYDPFGHPDVAEQLCAAHGNLDDVLWGADVIQGRLTVSGEIDMGDVERFRQVLHAAIETGITTVDLAGVHLLSATAIGVLADAAIRLRRSRRQLVLVHTPPLILRTLEIAGLIGAPESRPRTDDSTQVEPGTGSHQCPGIHG
jgi:anti-anti-sigma factor